MNILKHTTSIIDSQLPRFIEIQLSNGYICIVDSIDADLANNKWHCHSKITPYGVRLCKEKAVLMHRVILGRMIGRSLTKEEFVDHIDGNGLNNRRSNLRLATRFENARNIKTRKDNPVGLKGVSKCRDKWRARIVVNKKQYSLGTFATPEEAHSAYCKAAKELHGDFANFGSNSETILKTVRKQTP